MSGVPFEDIVEVLSAIAPPRLAASWDNVGTIITGTRPVSSVMLCVDFTAGVLAEVEETGADAVVAYHPPLFRGAKRLLAGTPQGRVILGAVRAGVHVYSPHTALDAAAGGLNDWLLEAFGDIVGVSPLEPDAVDPEVGSGRRATLSQPLGLSDLVTAIKRHLEVDTVRVAAPPELDGWGQREIAQIAVCPGAGGSVFDGVEGIDLFLTGEMRHHDVLAHVGAGAAVVLAEHTNTERGYLPRLAERITAAIRGVEVVMSEVDADPLMPW